MGGSRVHRSTSTGTADISTEGSSRSNPTLAGENQMLNTHDQGTETPILDAVQDQGKSEANKKMADDIVTAMTKLNDKSSEYGVSYKPDLPRAEKYFADLTEQMKTLTTDGRRALYPEWKKAEIALNDSRDYQNGHVDDGATLFEDPNCENNPRFHWQLTSGANASEALDVWLRGPTVADCGSTLVVVLLNALRNRLGPEKFNQLCALDAQKAGQYFICPDPKKTPLVHAISDIELYTAAAGDKGEVGNRAHLNRGDTVYFQNHRDYRKYAPDGLWNGENCIYEGDGLFSGFGVIKQTEAQLNQVILDIYNSVAPAEIDEAAFQSGGGGLLTNRELVDPLGRVHIGPDGVELNSQKVDALDKRL